MQDEFKPSQLIIFSSSKLKFQPRRFKKKWSSLWVVKEIRSDESPYSRRIKVVTRKLLQQRAHPL